MAVRLIPNEAPYKLSSNKIFIGINWTCDELNQSMNTRIDLDVSTVLFDEKGEIVDFVYFGNLHNDNGSVTHTGNHMGQQLNPDGTFPKVGEDDEQVVLCMDLVPRSVTSLLFVLNNSGKNGFQDIKKARARIVDTATQEVKALIELNAQGDHTAMILCKVLRCRGGWELTVVGDPGEGRTFGDIIPQMKKHLTPKVKIDGDEKLILLRKGETDPVYIDKTFGKPIRRLVMGLGWDVIPGNVVDLDASCVCFDNLGRIVDVVWFQKLKSGNGAIRHSGDNETGKGEFDDERIYVDLDRINSKITTLMFVVNSFKGQPFSTVETAYVRLLDKYSRRELIRFQLSCKSENTGLIMCKIFKQQKAVNFFWVEDGPWCMVAIGEGTKGRIYKDIIPEMRQHLIIDSGIIEQHRKTNVLMWMMFGACVLLAIFLAFLMTRAKTSLY